MEPGILRHVLAAFKVEKSNEITTQSLVGVRGGLLPYSGCTSSVPRPRLSAGAHVTFASHL